MIIFLCRYDFILNDLGCINFFSNCMIFTIIYRIRLKHSSATYFSFFATNDPYEKRRRLQTTD